MTTTKTYTVTNTDVIERLNIKAANKNRSLKPSFVRSLDPDGTHVLVFSMVHNDVEIRTRWMFKVQGSDEPVQAWLDMSFADFNALNTATRHEDGSITVS
jgi:hypothetical protein